MIRFFLTALLAVFFCPTGIVFAEYIERFETTIELHKDSSFVVTEEIVYNFESVQRHGIFRFIPTEHPQPASAWYKNRYIDIEVQGVTRNGNPEEYELSPGSDQLYIKIGSPVETVSGEQTYKIVYTVRGGLLYTPSKDAELYWNITGNEWMVSMKNIKATIVDVDGVLSEGRSCYQGREGERGSCRPAVVATGTVMFATGFTLPGAGMTVAAAVNQAVVKKVILEKTPMTWVWILGLLAWVGALTRFVYTRKTEHKTGAPTIPQYEPYKDLLPMYTGVLIDGSLDPKDITASILYLAQQGVVSIKKIEKKVLFFIQVDDYEIELKKDVSTIGNAFQQSVLTLLFGSSTVVGTKVTLGDLKNNLSQQTKNRVLIQSMEKDIAADMEEQRYFQRYVTARHFFSVAIATGLALAVVSVVRPVHIGMFVALVLVISFVSFIGLAFLYRRRTREGYEALDYLQGFKDFLSVTEKERYTFHNAPKKSPEQFMEYLPYAVAFGVEKEWADVFKDITIPDPAWYDSGDTASFSAVSLTDSLGAFSTAFASSSGASASSGGGTSGGGAGGGGGGSW